MIYKRIIRFQYYQILCKKFNGKKWGKLESFDLVELLQKLEENGKIKKNIEFNKTLARVECFTYDKASDTWGIRLMKLRDTNIPSKVKEKEEAKVIDLEPDEYIGEDVTLLYEKCSSIIMVQSNRFSLNISRIEELLRYLNEDENILIELQPIHMKFENSKFKKSNFKNIDISFANLSGWGSEEDKKQSLASIINPIKQLGGYVGHVTVGLGHVKEDSLNRVEAYNIISEIRSNKKFIRSAKVKIRDDDDTDVEVVDLFEDICHDFIEFSLESREALEYKDTIKAMIYRYKKTKAVLYELIAYKAE